MTDFYCDIHSKKPQHNLNFGPILNIMVLISNKLCLTNKNIVEEFLHKPLIYSEIWKLCLGSAIAYIRSGKSKILLPKENMDASIFN